MPTGEVDLQNDDISCNEQRCNRVPRQVDMIEIGRAIGVKRRRDGDHERIGGLGLRSGTQLAQRRRGAQQHVEIGFGEIGLAGIDRLDHSQIDVDTDDLHAATGQSRGGRQSDIAETDDAHGLDRVFHRSAGLGK